MFGLGFTEILLLGAIALIFIGPDQLPELARAIGSFLNELKRNSESFKNDIKSQVNFDLEEKRRELFSTTPKPSAPSEQSQENLTSDKVPESATESPTEKKHE